MTVNITQLDNDEEESRSRHTDWDIISATFILSYCCAAVAGSGEDESDDEEEQERQQQLQDIEDETGTNLVNLRRTIYLTIMSSLDFEEAGHKLMKIQLAPGQVRCVVLTVPL
jgi:pre-mRNA-splicing factor CWC22